MAQKSWIDDFVYQIHYSCLLSHVGQNIGHPLQPMDKTMARQTDNNIERVGIATEIWLKLLFSSNWLDEMLKYF